jgi:hypothetical protein
MYRHIEEFRHFYSRREIFLLAEQLLASQEGLCIMEFLFFPSGLWCILVAEMIC